MTASTDDSLDLVRLSLPTCMMSKQVGIKLDTNFTGMHCGAITGDRFCAGLAHLEEPIDWATIHFDRVHIGQLLLM